MKRFMALLLICLPSASLAEDTILSTEIMKKGTLMYTKEKSVVMPANVEMGFLYRGDFFVCVVGPSGGNGPMTLETSCYLTKNNNVMDARE